MKGTEKSKAQKIINKVQSGDFDENDIDNLFMRLRAYSKQNLIFREIADFVAHNDLRDRGITNQSLQAMYYSIKFFIEYISPKKSVDITQPFPSWIKKLIKYQIDKIDEQKLKDLHKVSKERLKSRIDKGFKDDAKSSTASLKQGKLSQQTLEAIRYVMGFIISKEAFTQKALVEQLIQVIDSNGLEYDRVQIEEQSNRITLCAMLLLHNANFDIKGHKHGYCSITSEKNSVSHNVRHADQDGNEIDLKESFGKLSIMGHVVLDKDGKDLTIGHPVMSTELEAEDWCSVGLFHIEPMRPEDPNYLCKRLKLDCELCINENFQLSEVGA